MAGLAAAAPVVAKQPGGKAIATSWQDEQGQAWLGLLLPRGDQLTIQTQLALPGRAHGVLWAPDGSVLAAARRPGDWLLRWWPQQGGRVRWRWSAAGQHFNGHLLRRADGHWLSSETDLADSQGLLVLRDRTTLEMLDSWPSGGRDPHALLADGDGHVLVANGGLVLDAASGRRVVADGPPASSLSRVAMHSGAVQSWRLADPWLSIRHLARAADGRVGVALQAQHIELEARTQAPLLALWDGVDLATVTGSHDGVGGYGADLTAQGQGLRVSATQANLLIDWQPDGSLQRRPLAGAGALSSAWSFGRGLGLPQNGPARALPTGCLVDNHAA
ncbi:MAG: DUF1513 domain-containing protein [Inhella sp.]